MVRRAASFGIRQIVAATHVSLEGVGRDDEADPTAVTEALQTQVRAAGIDITLVPGCETTLSSSLVAQVPAAPWLTIGGQRRYLLVMVELPSVSRWPVWADELVFRLALVQVAPVICHPERIPAVQRVPHLLLPAIRRGARVQITAASLTRRARRAERRCAFALLRLGAVSFVASDAHRVEDVQPGEVVDRVVAAVGREEARRILVGNPRLVLAGEPVPCPTGADGDDGRERARVWSRPGWARR